MFGKNFVITDDNAIEYVKKIGDFISSMVVGANRNGVVLGMSGGIDCSVAARLAQESGVGIRLYLMPDGEDMARSKSLEDAMKLIDKFNLEYKIINIKSVCDAVENAIAEPISDISRINIRPRVRMTTLYTIGQNSGRFVMGTGNLAERALGYFTKWGDGASDLNPLGMLTKSEVRVLASKLGVPHEIIDKPPSAGLFEGQTDEKDLGFTYSQIDEYILNGTCGNTEIDKKLIDRINMSAHKLNPIPIYGAFS
ncbi:MAG: NAD(+) synthase [Clostridiales bacterium]|nr:NAD(+) synthase [Clostridiales bacterium]